MLYLGIDPGKRTGSAWVAKRDGKIFTLDFGDIPWIEWPRWVQSGWKEQYNKFRKADEPILVVCENYLQRELNTTKYVKSPVERMIGAMYFRSIQLGWKFYLSEPSNKPMGYKLAKIKARESHGIDWQDALAHAYFAAHNGVRPNQRIIW